MNFVQLKIRAIYFTLTKKLDNWRLITYIIDRKKAPPVDG